MNKIIKLFSTIMIIVLLYLLCNYVLYRQSSYFDCNINNFTSKFKVKWNYYLPSKCFNNQRLSSTKKAFMRANIKSVNSMNPYNWICYMPCGFNNIESDLMKLRLYRYPKKLIFGISGCDRIVSKNSLWKIMRAKYGQKSYNLMPATFLYTPEDLQLFKQYYDSNQTQLYILKKNLQRKEGILLTNDYDTIIGLEKEDFTVIQRYISDPYLIDERKLNLRLYLLIVYNNNNHYYFSHKYKKCIYTNKKYDKDSTDFGSHITSFELDMSIYDKLPINFDDYKSTNKKQIIKSLNSNISHVCSAIDDTVYQLPNHKKHISVQMFALDYVIDKANNVYLLEINKGPDMIPKSDIDRKFKDKIMDDMMSLIGLRSNLNLFNMDSNYSNWQEIKLL